MSGTMTRGLCSAAAGIALAASTLATAGAAPGTALAASMTARPVVAAGGARLWLARYSNGSATAMAVSPGGTTVYATGRGGGSAVEHDPVNQGLTAL